jgi:hypothetical protein
MRLFGEKAILARHSYKKIRKHFPDCGNSFKFIGYADVHEKDV